MAKDDMKDFKSIMQQLMEGLDSEDGGIPQSVKDAKKKAQDAHKKERDRLGLSEGDTFCKIDKDDKDDVRALVTTLCILLRKSLETSEIDAEGTSLVISKRTAPDVGEYDIPVFAGNIVALLDKTDELFSSDYVKYDDEKIQ